MTASSTTPSLCRRPGLEHMEKPPTVSTPGMNRSTLHSQAERQVSKSVRSGGSNYKIMTIFILKHTVCGQTLISLGTDVNAAAQPICTKKRRR